MTRKIVYGKQVVVDADTVIPSGAVLIEGDTIIEMGRYESLKKNNPS